MKRLVPVLAGCLATAVVGGFVAGSPIVSLVFVAPLVALLAFAVVDRRRLARVDGPWFAPVTTRPVLAGPGSGRQVASALGWVESRELARSPWFGVGIGFLLVIFVAFAVVYSGDNGDVWFEAAGLSPWFVHPLAGMTILAAHRAVTRPARDGTDELFEACPSEPAVRTAALLRTAVVPVVAFAGFLAVYGVAIYVRSPAIHGPVSLDALPVLLAGPVLAAGAVCLGVAIGSWVRFGLAPIVAVVGIGLLALRLWTAGDPGWNGSSALSTMGPQADSPLLLSLMPTWWYLGWLTALTIVVAVVAMLRFRLDRPTAVVGVVGLALAVVAAVMVTGPLDADDAQAVADLIARPGDHQTCATSSDGRVTVCTYDHYGELRDRVFAAVTPVASTLPSGVETLTIRQGFDGTSLELPPEVRRLLPGGVPVPPANELRIEYSADDTALLGYRLRLAFAAVGLQLPAEADDKPLAIGGQARGVVALWLAARGLDLDDALGLATVESPGDADENQFFGGENDAFERGLAWPSMCGPVVWSPQDLEGARALMREPEAEIAAVINGDLGHWSDPATRTDELLDALDVPSTGPYEEVVSRVESFC